ncbi:MAG TPA: hypothetical protein VE547_22050 [Mycobacteriales bacterium]|nr:hypothetical protein [Mycobacteriales bacterium]
MLEPVGPLPASVYWRRRALALVAVLMAVLLLWAVWPGGGDGGERREASAVSPTDDPSGTPGALAATPPANDPGRAGGSGTSGTSAGTGGGTGSAVAGGPSTQTQPRATPTTPRAAPPTAPCADRSLQLRVVPERPTYRVGTMPVIDLVVRNVSEAACHRDLGPAQQEVLLFDGPRRLWSSNDCYPGGTRDVQVLQPGDSASFSVTWSGLSSQPRCAGVRTRLPAGDYQLLARLGTLTSSRAPLGLR